jgi:hypothetical protein
MANYSNLTSQERADLATARAKEYANPNANTWELDEGAVPPSVLLEDLTELSSKLQTDWNQLQITDLGAGWTDDLRDGLNTLSVAIDAIRPIITLLVEAGRISAQLAAVGAEAFALALQSATLFLEAFVDLLSSTGAHVLSYVPKNSKMLKSTRDVLQTIATSYDDEFDDSRPISRSDSDAHFFVGVFVNAPNYFQLINAVKELGKLFDYDVPTAPDAQALRDLYPNSEYKQGQAQYPNWGSIAVNDLPLVRGLVDGINGAVLSLKGVSGRTQVLVKTLELIEQRIGVLDARVQSILSIIDALLNITFNRSVNLLTLYGVGNIDDFKTKLTASASLATYPIPTPEVEFCAAFCFHTVLGTGRALDFFQSLFEGFQSVTESYDTTMQTTGESIRGLALPDGKIEQSLGSASDQIDALWKANED